MDSGRFRNAALFAAGLPFLALAKAKHLIGGYSTPKPFKDLDRCIEYDVAIAQRYIAQLGGSVKGMHILELGPGSDLGVGLYLLNEGAASYTAVDRNALAADAAAFHAVFCMRIGAPVELVDRLRYVVLPSFDLDILRAKPVDAIVSNAAFEHFDDVPRTLREVGALLKPGGKLAITVDLKTHSRWIVERDPNNIYRYPTWLYRLFRFPGQPNRVRPKVYTAAMTDWQSYGITVERKADSLGGFAAEFGPDADMHVLEMVVEGVR